MIGIVRITLMAYAMGLAGFLGGALCAMAAHRLSKAVHRTLSGFTAGLLLALICFAMLPLAFSMNGLAFSVAGILLGLAASTLLEGRVEKLAGGSRGLRAGLLICLGIALHKLPEGMAVGSLLKENMALGLPMAVVVAMHCFPESAFMSFSLKDGGVSHGKLLALCFAICAPMALGALIGACVAGVSTAFVSLCLAFAGGVMIYVTCGEVIPDKLNTLEGGLNAAGAVLGFAIGAVLTAGM